LMAEPPPPAPLVGAEPPRACPLSPIRDTGPEANDPRRTAPAAPEPAARAGVPPPAVGPAAATGMRRARLAVDAPDFAVGADTPTATGDEGAPTCGQPWKETIALAIKNRTAAPASSDPVVPKPARYARVARTSAFNRRLCPKPLALFKRNFSVPCPFTALDATPETGVRCGSPCNSLTVSLSRLPT
jgi:hypothetical protein